MPRPLASARAAAAAAVALAAPAAIPAAQAPPDPFTPGERWSHAPDPAAPWIPRDVALAGGDELVWAAPAVAGPHVVLLGGAAGEPLHAGPPLTGAIGPVRVAAGEGPDALFALVQLPDPDAWSRRTELRRYDAVAASAAGTPLAAAWTATVGGPVGGGARLAAGRGGGPLVVAVHDPLAGTVRLEWRAPGDGALVAGLDLAGAALGALAVARGGALAALAAGLDLWVAADGVVVHHERLDAATSCLALSEDGARLVVGAPGEARLLAEAPGGGYAPLAVLPGAPAELPVRAALSDAAETVAVGWWDAADGAAVRLATWDGPTLAPLHAWATSGTSGLQDQPSALAVTPDGARIALGLWGQLDAGPEVLLFERGAPEPLFAWDAAGSVEALALDASGTRVAAAVKDGHANVFATTGAVRAWDTGERDLQALSAPRPGGALELAHLAPGAAQVVFGVGTPAPAPQAVPGVTGVLALELARPLVLVPARPDAAGRADLVLPLAPGPALVGLALAAQALALGGGSAALSATAVPLAVL